MNKLLNPLSTKKRQNGAALIVLFVTIIASGAVFFISRSLPENHQVSAENKTTEALSIAKNAIISYAVAYYFSTSPGNHGFLPCPETTNSAEDGLSVLNCAVGGARYVNQLGRLPWKSLQIPPLKDATGECLWYAMSGSFSPSPRSLMLNDDTPGMLQVTNESGNIFNGNTAEDRAVAVIIAPNSPLNNQARGNVNANTVCNVPHNLVNAANYLETHQNINNTSVSNINPDLIDQFITANALSDNPSINDRIITITSNEIFGAIKSSTAMYNDKIKVLGENIGQCLVNYAQASAVSPTNCANLSNCNLNCTNARSLCLVAANSVTEISTCNQSYATCNTVCRDSCLNSGSFTPVYHLPWPASVNINTDYRINANYKDQLPVNTYLGRLPFSTVNSSNLLPNLSDATIFTSCALQDANPEMFNLWQNWKDHWFYVVGQDFSPTANTPPPIPCVNCPQFNNNVRYAGLLIFSGERNNNQLRRANETENPDPIAVNSKAALANYLEAGNLANDPDASGNGNYNTTNTNERIFCIPQNLTPPVSVTECVP